MSEHIPEAQPQQFSEEQLKDIERQRQEFVNRSRAINDYCLEYGCIFVPAWIIGIEVAYFEACLADLKRTQSSKDEVYHIINGWFTALQYRPFSRAHFIYRAQRTPIIREFSHHLERGLLHYYLL